MPDTADTKHEVPDNHIEDAKENGDAVGEGAKPHLLPILPILLGVFIVGLNIFAVFWLRQSVFLDDFSVFTGSNWPVTVFLASIIISVFIGLFLIIYAMFLRRLELKEPVRVPTYVKWVLVPVLVALPAPALTVWAAQMVEPIAPKPCIELYQDAVNIRKDAPDFKMAWTDRDQLRCNINSVLPKK